MTVIKNYTDIEQSKILAKILPLESADMCFGINDDTLKYNNLPWLIPYYKYTAKEFYVPCWSLAKLMILLPSKFTEKGKYSETTYNIDIRKYALTEDVDLYQIAYGNYKWYEDGNYSWKDMINTGEKENLIDVCYDMIIKLNEQNIL